MTLDLWIKGGVLMWPILACSIVGVALALHRLFFFRAAVRNNRLILSRVVPLVASDRVADAARQCEETKGPVAAVLRAHFTVWDLPLEKRKEILTVIAEREMSSVDWGLRGLALIARLSPLLGLLGTVLGLVEAFRVFSTVSGPPNPSLLAGGIWEALITTVAGLTVAIPAMLAYEWFESRAEDQALAIRHAVTEVESVRRT